MKECIRGWVLEYDYREIDRKHAISVTHEVNRKIFKLLRKRIDKCTKRYGPPKDFSIMSHVDPALLHWYKKRHGVLEDGSSDDGIGDIGMGKVNQGANDSARVSFYYRHILAVKVAIEKGVNVKGFFPWSFLDTFEWGSRFSQLLN
ncbi:beta-glucosidase 12-like protein [Tanacetum coccineum]